MARKVLKEVNFPQEKIAEVLQCIEMHRFKKGMKAESLEAKILQDADRLDIVGAIGIARVFTRSGWSNQPIHTQQSRQRKSMMANHSPRSITYSKRI